MDKTKIDAPITEVLVMEDRAQVTRRSNLILRPGNYILELEDLTPLINEGNIQFYFEKNRAIVHNFQIKRRLKLESANSNLENDYQKSINDLEKQGRSLWYQIMNKTSRYNYLTKTSTALAKQMDEHLSLGNLNPNWIDGYAEIWKDQDDITYEVFDLTKKWEDIRFQFEKETQKMNEIENPKSRYTASVILNVEVKDQTDLQLIGKYTVPCALWRAYYTAELNDSLLNWDTCACLWQKTGENWVDVDLTFSTARPSIGAELALLNDDLLEKKKKTEDELKNVQIESRDQSIEVSTQGAGEP